MSRDAARRCACATLLGLMVALAGCTLGLGKRRAVAPPPAPAAVQPPAPDLPLSIPQTAVTLPNPQPVNTDAIPTLQAAQQSPAPGKTEAPPAPRALRRSAAVPPKPDPEPEAETPPAPAPPEQPAIRPILSGDEQKRIRNVIDARKKEIAEKMSHVKGRLSESNQSLVDRINSFLEQCDEAERRSDYSQADELSVHALVLAGELRLE